MKTNDIWDDLSDILAKKQALAATSFSHHDNRFRFVGKVYRRWQKDMIHFFLNLHCLANGEWNTVNVSDTVVYVYYKKYTIDT